MLVQPCHPQPKHVLNRACRANEISFVSEDERITPVRASNLHAEGPLTDDSRPRIGSNGDCCDFGCRLRIGDDEPSKHYPCMGNLEDIWYPTNKQKECK